MGEIVPISDWRNAQQAPLLCGCGSYTETADGLCPQCGRRQRLNLENFDGQRETVLRRDDYQCQVCGERDSGQIVVHHRPGVNRLITLCRKHHAMIHLTLRPSFGFSIMALLRRLWRELHRDVAEQRLLTELMEEQRMAVQQPLFDPTDGA
jgi:hypothetical protein